MTSSHVHTLGVCNYANFVGTVCVKCRVRVEDCQCDGVTYD